MNRQQLIRSKIYFYNNLRKGKEETKKSKKKIKPSLFIVFFLISIQSKKQTQTNRACNICNLVVMGPSQWLHFLTYLIELGVHIYLHVLGKRQIPFSLGISVSIYENVNTYKQTLGIRHFNSTR